MNIARYSQQSYEASNFLRQSSCGYNGWMAYGCCPTTQLAPQGNQIQSQQRPTQAQNQFQQRPNQVQFQMQSQQRPNQIQSQMQSQSQPNQVQSQMQTQQLPRNFVEAVKSLLPKPPVCGVDAEDRIFGGTRTGISEFPWFALLKYSKRKFHLNDKS